MPDRLNSHQPETFFGFIFLKLLAVVERWREQKTAGREGWIDEKRDSLCVLAGWLWFHALCLCNRASGGGYAGLRRMDDPRGAFGAGLPGTAPRAAGPAVHHEQTVGKTVSCCSFCCSIINEALHVLWVSGLSGLNVREFIVEYWLLWLFYYQFCTQLKYCMYMCVY